MGSLPGQHTRMTNVHICKAWPPSPGLPPPPPVQTGRAPSPFWDKPVFLSRMEGIWSFLLSELFHQKHSFSRLWGVKREGPDTLDGDALCLLPPPLGSGKLGSSLCPLTARIRAKPEHSVAVLHLRDLGSRSYGRFPAVQRTVAEAASRSRPLAPAWQIP